MEEMLIQGREKGNNPNPSSPDSASRRTGSTELPSEAEHEFAACLTEVNGGTGVASIGRVELGLLKKTVFWGLILIFVFVLCSG